MGSGAAFQVASRAAPVKAGRRRMPIMRYGGAGPVFPKEAK
jgi:hypothetical protein